MEDVNSSSSLVLGSDVFGFLSVQRFALDSKLLNGLISAGHIKVDVRGLSQD